MKTNRLEAFSDGVFAILITIMVLEFHIPQEASLEALLPLIPVFLSYLMSFIMLGIYWNNHHHLLQASKHVNGAVLWANVHLLFWLSLVPFVTGWMGEHNFAPVPVGVYGVVMCFAGFAYYLLSRALVALHGGESTLAKSLGRDWKGLASLAMYIAAIALSFVNSWISCAVYVAVLVMWIIPDRRLEKGLVKQPSTE